MNNKNNQYPANVGALFKNAKRTTDKAPLLTGLIELDRPLVVHLSRLIQSGQKAKLTLGGWKNVSSNGESYYTIKATPEFKPQESVLPFDDEEGIDL